MTFEELEKAMQPYLDKDAVVIAKDHPHYKEICHTIKVDKVMGKAALLCKGEWNEEFYIFSGRDLQFINS